MVTEGCGEYEHVDKQPINLLIAFLVVAMSDEYNLYQYADFTGD